MTFENELKAKFERIFGIAKVTFDTPGESHEQGCIFIQVETSKNNINDGRQSGKVTGKIVIFGQSEKIPYGYFSKRIAGASAADLEGLYFYEFETNTGIYRNIAERSTSFVYLFNSEYDPSIGSITSIETTLETN